MRSRFVEVCDGLIPKIHPRLIGQRGKRLLVAFVVAPLLRPALERRVKVREERVIRVGSFRVTDEVLNSMHLGSNL